MKKRLTALETKVAQEGGVLTESQLVALERASKPRLPPQRGTEGPYGLKVNRSYLDHGS
jgi:hypothetical protein